MFSGRKHSPKGQGTPESKADAGAPESPETAKGATPKKEDDDFDLTSKKEDEEDKHSEGSKDSDEKRKIKAAKLKKANTIPRRERLKRFAIRLFIFLKWFITEGFAVLTCHYRGRKRNYRRNHWVKIPDRSGRQLDLRTKREDWNDSQLHEWKHQVERKKMRRVSMMFRTWKMGYENSRDDSRNYIAEKLRLNHRKTGLPRGLLEWFHFQELVHQGPHGYVYKAEDMHHRTVAIKLRDKSKGNMGRMPFRRARKTLKRQVVDGHIPILKLMRKLLARCSCGLVRSSFSHPHIATIFTVWENFEYYIEICEWLPGHSLQEYTEKREHRMDEHHVCETFMQILTAIQYMHSRRLIHRDIRINQIMMPLTKDEDADPSLEDQLIPDIANVKICEGWCMMKLPRRGHYFDKPLAGDMATRAPEVLMHNLWTTKADIWSAGCLLFELLYGHLPFGGEDDALVDRVIHDDPEFDLICGHASDEAVDLLHQLLARRPAQRLSATQALAHEWFSKNTVARPKNMKRTEDHLIRDIRLDGKMPAARRGMDPSNLLVATTGMLNAGFCTFMGSTRCEMDFLIGGEGEREDHHYWVRSVCVSLWATEDNPQTITLYASSRPNTTWSQIAQHTVEGEGSTEARITVDKPVRYLRLGLAGNFGGVLGVALRKVSFYGYQIRQLPIVLDLDKAGYARGSERHVHNNQMAGEEVRGCPKFLVPFLEKGQRIPGTGQRHMVYRDVNSGPPHVQTVVALHMPTGPNMPKGLHIIAAALQLRSCNILHSGTIPPKMRVTIDDGQPTGRQFVCSTAELRPSPWQADQILTKGYEDAAVSYAENLNLITDEGLVLELNFENNGGYIHIPVDFGFMLYYVPEMDSDDSDYEEEKREFAKKERQAKKNPVKHSGIDMAQLAEKNEDDGLAEAWSEHADSETCEKQLEGDLKQMREICKYGAWGAGNALQKEVDDWLPRQEDSLAIEAARTPQEREALQGIDPKLPWWEAGQSTDSEPDSWGTADSGTEEPSSRRSAQKSTKKLSGFGGHAMARVSKNDDNYIDEDISEESIHIEGVDERGFVVDANETKEEKYERLLDLPREELNQGEIAFIAGIEKEHEAMRMATAKRVIDVHEKLRKDYENKARAQAEQRREGNYQQLVHVRPDLLEYHDPDELRKLASEKYELRYAPDGTKRMVRIKEEGGLFWECTAACREETGRPSPCCESAKDAISECAPAVLNPFTPPAPPSSPRKSGAAGAPKATAKGCVVM